MNVNRESADNTMKVSTQIDQEKFLPLFQKIIVFLCFALLAPSVVIATGQGDVDGDGVTRSQELLDETNSNDADSYIERGAATYCVDWNGFLGNLKQILELRNSGCSELSLRTQLRDISGNVRETLNYTLAPSQQRDLILNDMSGFDAESYGTVCSSILSGDAGTLAAQLSVYDLSNDTFRFAYAAPFVPGRTGSQFLGYNHIFPSLNPTQSGNFVAGFLQISNDEVSSQSGKVIFFSANGVQLKEVQIEVAARGRFDLDTHSLGANSVGMIEWRPDAADKKFRVLLTRYYFADSSTSFLVAALSVAAKRGSGYLLAAPFDATNRIAAVELSNTLDTSVDVPVTVYTANGEEATHQPGTITVAAKSTRHVVLNESVTSGIGKVQINPNTPESIVATLLEYQLRGDLYLASAIAVDLKAGFGESQRASYNNFLGDCRLRLANISATDRAAAISMKRFDGTSIEINSPVTVPAQGVVEVDICSNDGQSAYGEVKLTPPAAEVLTGSLIRTNRDSSVEFGSALVEYGICSAGIASTPTTLALVAGSNSTQHFTISNNSSAVIAEDIEAALPDTWDVTQDASDCASVAPGASCELELTPGATVYGATNIAIRGTNTQQLDLTVSVVAPTVATISVAGSPLSLDAGGASDVLTVTNTSPYVTATNIGADFTGTALTGDVTETGNTCATVAPLASCTLTFTSGGALQAQTTFPISGDNTTVANGAIAIVAPANAVISVTGSPLVIETNGASGTLTINNTSLFTAATNVTSNFTATALDGSVVETGNTCATVAPQASCTLTFTPGSTVVAETDFTIQGSNTNAVVAAIEIEQSVTLDSINSNSGTASGGAGVTLTGAGLTGATGVTFDGVAATSVNVVNSTTVTAVTPAHAAGVVDVVITTPSGSATLTNGYMYVATVVGQAASGGTIACLNGGLNNLVAATADNSTAIEWGGLGTAIGAGAQSNSDGASNTAAIVVALGNNGGTPYAAKLCNDYEVDSQGNTPCEAGNACYNDWFLPAGNSVVASGQLNCMFTNRIAIGGFAGANYSSSTEFAGNPTNDAWAQVFSNSIQANVSKNTVLRTRCVRSFTP